MKKYGLLIIIAHCCFAANATSLDSLANRLCLFGERIPQEKVFVHMDNTCYWLGDTIWFAAYTRQTNTDAPSEVSKVLYAELWNHEGYLMERKTIEMREGRGNGFFALTDTTMYGGFYELRAYTRWQLNWGEYEHPHRDQTEKWFFNDIMAREYFRDYEKLYSRVFPVYDKPAGPGEFFHDMTSRPMQRLLKTEAPKQKVASLMFFPEGGTLVEGLLSRVAFEATTDDGEWCEGMLEVSDGNETVAHAQTLNRGRGIFTLTPIKGKKYTAFFTPTHSESGGAQVQGCKQTLPGTEKEGVGLNVSRSDVGWTISVMASKQAAQEALGLTVMHEGRLEKFETIAAGTLADGFSCMLAETNLPAGVHQVSVFDTDGRLWADRLFFVTRQEETRPNITISGRTGSAAPFSRIELDVQSANTDSGQHISLAVRDATHPTPTFDTGNIMTEMLLSSEIRGYVPQPDWFFEKDDEEHLMALDLLMLTQGWRRFNWQDIAVSGRWELVQPAEQAPILMGSVHKYTGHLKEDQEVDGWWHGRTMNNQLHSDINKSTVGDIIQTRNAGRTNDPYAMPPRMQNLLYGYNHRSQGKGYKHTSRMDSIVNLSKGMRKKMAVDGEKMRREVRVHAEFTNLENTESVKGDVETEHGRFSIKMPRFNGECLFFLAASDTVKWKRKFEGLFRKRQKHQWIMPNEDEYPEFYVRLSWPYPRFIKPYTYYQTHLPGIEDVLELDAWLMPEGTTLQSMEVQNKRGRLRNFRFTKPAFTMDAYKAYNMVIDAGLLDGWYAMAYAMARCMVADMGGIRYYPHGGALISKSAQAHMNRRRTYDEVVQSSQWRNHLKNVERVGLYTDYEPRLEGDPRYYQNVPSVNTLLEAFPPGVVRVTYRDRFFVLPGFAYRGQFYNPDYSHRQPSATDNEAYRRTLYWNPDLQLDANGHATVSFYNNGQQTKIAVSAEGMTADGRLLTVANDR